MAFDASSRDPLFGDLDIDKLVRAVPPGHTIKGAFVAKNAEILAASWAKLEPSLVSPPRGGKYLAFSDYPLVDYLRVTDKAARKKFPGASGREAHRLLSRDTFDVFAGTTLGRVTTSLLSGPASALTKYPELYNRLVHGSRVEVVILEPRVAEADFSGYYSTTEAIYGVLEGIVLACGGDPTVTVQAKEAGHFVARVTWVPV